MTEAMAACLPPRLQVSVTEHMVLVEQQGEMDEPTLRLCQQRVLELARETGLRSVLYDARAMSAPEASLALKQQDLGDEGMGLRRAIVVPCAKIAYLARIAFGAGEHRVFYDDIEAALAWLRAEP